MGLKFALAIMAVWPWAVLAGILRGSVLVGCAWWCQIATETAGKLLILNGFFEQSRTENPRVVGSIPTLATNKNKGLPN